MFAPFDLPAPPRSEFGVRSPRPYLPHDSVLLLNKRAPAEARRLTLLTDAGEAVGEIYLKPEEPAPARPIYNAAHLGEEHQAPYFPGDLEDAEVSSRPASASASVPDAPTKAKTARPRSVAPAVPAPEPHTLASPARHGLAADLLHALALALAREHDALCDRLMDIAARL